MVKIRLARYGGKKKPFYRIVAADSRSPRDGRLIEVLGTYDPSINPPAVKLDESKIKIWLDRGAMPTETVSSILKRKAASN